eukprot:TRINITY_DN802_c0_g1_i1.p1 TRINITY_DN802_c0_g1~~TRINITY_DN802_c0_g1_i1.p1  ORF type:complete len:687 (+),score=245.87 TRINITY_DN802_c0_g1_i1:36-2096(+)
MFPTGYDGDSVIYQKQSQAAQKSEQHIRATQKFQDFIRNFRKDGVYLYRDQLRRHYNLKMYWIEVNLTDLSSYDEELCNTLVSEPNDYINLFEEAAKEAVAHTIGQESHDEVRAIQVMIISDQQPTAVRSLKASHMSKIAMVSGLIVASSRVQAKATSMTVKCRKCGHQHVLHVKPGFGGADLPPFCHGNQNKCGQNPYQILPDQSEFIDQQILKLQETPESVPTGELPRHIQLVVDRYLVGRAVPGTRVTMLGIYSIYKATGRMQQAGSGVALRYPYLRVLGVRIDNEGSGRVNQTFTEEEVQEFTEISRLPDLYNLIVKSIAPAIFGHEDVKRTIACQLFGGCRKVLPDGMKLRGDINVLLLGDPGTAKSQLLKFVEKVAPIGVYTSGKGSSAAGLTASVVRDASSREFYLEGGAMVLADGGIVCIDEFDKMRSQDRVAIHEAMEQQTISIAKAGITTILNSRTAVLAAANPVFGSYDESRSAVENLNEFRSTILSRFDAIFLIKDTRSEARDRTIAEHVMKIHINHNNMTHPDAEIDINKLKRYIAYCRARCAPRLSSEASEILTHQYVTMRARHRAKSITGGSDVPIPLTVRQLEAIVRISESLAKMTLSNTATRTHVEEAIRLFTVSTVEAINSGEVVLEEMNDTMRAELDVQQRNLGKEDFGDQPSKLRGGYPCSNEMKC